MISLYLVRFASSVGRMWARGSSSGGPPTGEIRSFDDLSNSRSIHPPSCSSRADRELFGNLAVGRCLPGVSHRCIEWQHEFAGKLIGLIFLVGVCIPATLLIHKGACEPVLQRHMRHLVAQCQSCSGVRVMIIFQNYRSSAERYQRPRKGKLVARHGHIPLCIAHRDNWYSVEECQSPRIENLKCTQPYLSSQLKRKRARFFLETPTQRRSRLRFGPTNCGRNERFEVRDVRR